MTTNTRPAAATGEARPATVAGLVALVRIAYHRARAEAEASGAALPPPAYGREGPRAAHGGERLAPPDPEGRRVMAGCMTHGVSRTRWGRVAHRERLVRRLPLHGNGLFWLCRWLNRADARSEARWTITMCRATSP